VLGTCVSVNRVNIQTESFSWLSIRWLQIPLKQSWLACMETYVTSMSGTVERFLRNKINATINKRTNSKNSKWSETDGRLNVAFDKERIILIQPHEFRVRITYIFAFSSFKLSLHTTEIMFIPQLLKRPLDKFNFHVCISKFILLPFVRVQVWPNSLLLQLLSLA